MEGLREDVFEWIIESGVAVNSRRNKCCCSNKCAIDPLRDRLSRPTSVLNFRANMKLGDPKI